MKCKICSGRAQKKSGLKCLSMIADTNILPSIGKIPVIKNKPNHRNFRNQII